MNRYLELDPGATVPGCDGSAKGGATLAEAAAATGRSPHQLRRAIRSGRLAAERIQGPRGFEYRIDLQTLATVAERKGSARDGGGAAIDGGGVVTVAAGAIVHRDSAQVQRLEEEVTYLRDRLVAAEERERELLATVKDLRGLLLRVSPVAPGNLPEALPASIRTGGGRFPDVSPPPMAIATRQPRAPFRAARRWLLNLGLARA